MAISTRKTDVVVVGGGLTGLTTASYLGRAGSSVRVLEMAKALGGRASTDDLDGFLLNRGPHALYNRGEAKAVLRELGVRYSAGAAPTSGLALGRGSLHRLPVGSASLLATSLLGWAAKAEAARWLAALPRVRSSELDDLSVEAWLSRMRASDDVASLFKSFVRVSTYANAPESFSAGTAVRQVQKAFGGVSYVDGGWQSLVDGLAAQAQSAGAAIDCGLRAAALTPTSSGFVVETGDGRDVSARAVVLAVSRVATHRLLGTASVSAPVDSTPKIHMASLDIGLATVPRPSQRFVLGVDQPLYLSVHSGVARLGTRGAVLHVAKYLPDGESDPRTDRAELEALLDLAQPGWRSELIASRFLPRLTVAERLDTAATSGTKGRPDVHVPDLPGAFIAGDWVRGGSWLADAAMGSGKRAALAAAAHLAHERAVA